MLHGDHDGVVTVGNRGANLMVMHMMQNIRDNLHDLEDDEELEAPASFSRRRLTCTSMVRLSP